MSTPTFDFSGLIAGLSSAFQTVLNLIVSILPFLIIVGVTVGLITVVTRKLTSITGEITGSAEVF